MDATEKFTGKAEIYAKYRPDYPEKYIEYLVHYNSLKSGDTIADVGSGTGILTQELLENGFRVMAVEPNDDMRGIAEITLKKHSNFNSIKGTAENTGLQNKSVDLITVAQAFHWFDLDKFKLECQRILKPDRNVALVWNSRDSSSQFVIDQAEIDRKFCPLFNGFSGGSEENPDLYSKFFKDGKYEYQTFRHDSELDLNGFIGRNLSGSYAPKDTDPNYSEFIDAITELFYKYSKNNKIVIPNITRSYIGKV